MTQSVARHVSNQRWYSLYLCAAIVLISTLTVRPAYAQADSVVIHNVSQQDIDGDGQHDQTEIDCAFVTTNDRITVVDQAGDMQQSAQWREATDFDDDIWLYDIGADGLVELIVVYRIQEGRANAFVYDDRDDDGNVRHVRKGKTITIDESPYWSARIVSSSTWFLPDGRLNLNIYTAYDGPISSFDRMPDVYRRDWLKHDGVVDAEGEEVADADGIGRYVLIRLLAPSPYDWGFERSSLLSNEGRYPTGLYPQAFFPWLPVPIDRQDPRYQHLRYFDLPLSIGVDWRAGKVLGPRINGYPIGHGFHFNNNQYLNKGETNTVAFESPQAYYDLANNHDPYPELHIRFFTRAANDPTMWSVEGMEEVPWQSISYSWNLFNPGSLRWDFKLGLGGNHTINSVVRFNGFSLRTVPFDNLPYWITNREWKMTTFVAREGQGYESAEGIYEWQTDTGEDPESGDNRSVETREASNRYMLGLTSTQPDAFYQHSREGFRAERHFASPAKPMLYFSPVDRKLHLRGAEAGVWNIDGHQEIRYVNLNKDDFLDGWQSFDQNVLRRQLYTLPSHMLLADEQRVLLKQADIQPQLFEVHPPRNHADWSQLRERLTAEQTHFAPDDFRSMLEQFAGQEWQVAPATLADIRRTNQGFRFVLELQPGFRTSGSGGPPLQSLQPGRYVVTYDHDWHVEALTPPEPSAELDTGTFTELESGTLRVRVRNDGQEDLAGAELQVWASQPGIEQTLVATRTLDLLAQVPLTLTLDWTPEWAGEWQINTTLLHQGSAARALGQQTVTVGSLSSVAPAVIIENSTNPTILPFVIVGLISFSMLAARLFAQQFNPLTSDKTNDRS